MVRSGHCSAYGFTGAEECKIMLKAAEEEPLKIGESKYYLSYPEEGICKKLVYSLAASRVNYVSIPEFKNRINIVKSGKTKIAFCFINDHLQNVREEVINQLQNRIEESGDDMGDWDDLNLGTGNFPDSWLKEDKDSDRYI